MEVSEINKYIQDIQDIFELNKIVKDDSAVYSLLVKVKNGETTLFKQLIPLYPRNQYFGKDYDLLYGVNTLIFDITTLMKDKDIDDLYLTVTNVCVSGSNGTSLMSPLIAKVYASDGIDFLRVLHELLDKKCYF